MAFLRSMRADETGSMMTDFALVAPMFFMLLFGIIEGSRLLWTQQTLEEVAYSTARCMSVSSNCDDDTARQEFASERALNYGIGITSASITVESDVTCRGFPNSSRVAINHNFDSVMKGFIPGFQGQVVVESCYPVLPSA